MAFGEGLGRISKVAWSDSVANVHTAAVPPWMVQSEEEYKRCNQRQLAPNGAIPGSQHSVQDTWTQKIGRAQTGSSETGDSADTEKEADDTNTHTAAAERIDPNWLPNFGGVWQEGPRSKTKQEFAKLMPLRASALQFRPASVVYQRRRQVTPSQVLPSTPASSVPSIQPAPVALPQPQRHQHLPPPTPTNTSSNQSTVGETTLPPPPEKTAQPPLHPMVQILLCKAVFALYYGLTMCCCLG